ncbi:MAG: leucyl aminopeptidase, partial [Pseudomonadota bacterium]
GEAVEIAAPTGLKNSRILVIGAGEPADFGPLEAEALGGQLVARLAKTRDGAAALWVDSLADGLASGDGVTLAEAGARAALGARLRGYRFDAYRTTLKPTDRSALQKVTLVGADASGMRAAFQPLAALASGVEMTRDLVSEPANVLHPVEFAARCQTLSDLGVKVETLGEKRMEKLGMGALLGVGRGSEIESKLVVMEWRGGKSSEAPVALIGKGVTFDTGGISIKPAAGMEAMKWDMGGAGAVVGAMAALAGRKAPVNVVGAVGLVENMPDGRAQRPGDVVTTMSGQTVEVLNTDAEGRLVLCDVMHYIQNRHKPRAMVDLATLTGAIIISLAHEYAGLFTPDDDIAEQLTSAGQDEAEPVWRMPMGPAYDKMLESPIADMKNIGGRAGGSITAAQFLKRFVKDTPWAHLDIAGVAWADKESATTPKGGSGYGVRLLDRWIRDNYENV